jgi:hypothetical protein
VLYLTEPSGNNRLGQVQHVLSLTTPLGGQAGIGGRIGRRIRGGMAPAAVVLTLWSSQDAVDLRRRSSRLG